MCQFFATKIVSKKQPTPANRNRNLQEVIECAWSRPAYRAAALNANVAFKGNFTTSDGCVYQVRTIRQHAR